MINKKTRFNNILLVNSPGTEADGYKPNPLGILYLASYLRKYCKGMKIGVVDGAFCGEEEVKRRILTDKPNLVGLSALTPSRHNALKIAKYAKRNIGNCRVVLGGIHPTLMWKQLMMNYPYIDYIVKGEGEETLFDLVSGKNLRSIEGLVWRSGKQIVENIDRVMIQNLDKIPFPARDLLNPMKYPARGEGVFNGINLETEPRVPIIFSRGCMGTCTFCSSWRIWKGYRYRLGRNVADEIESVITDYGAKHFAFQDDTLTGNREEIINFCNEIIRRKIMIAIFGTTRVDMVDGKLLRIMRKAGFYEISYGIESGSPRMLQKINKKTDLELIKNAVKNTKKAGISVCALMMFGLPGETEKDRLLTRNLLNEIKPEQLGCLGVVLIFPGTVLYEQAKLAGLISDKFWLGKRPYYIYRGGIGEDPVDKKLLFKDWHSFYVEKTLLGRMIFNPLLHFKREYLNVWVYHLRHKIHVSS